MAIQQSLGVTGHDTGHAVPWPRIFVFVVLAYALSWACWLPLIVHHDRVGQSGWPTQAPGLLGPLAAALVVTALTQGRAGLCLWAKTLVRWRLPARWWLFALSPLALVTGCLALHLILPGQFAGLQDFGRYSGFPVAHGGELL